jgi:hypothetical protein
LEQQINDRGGDAAALIAEKAMHRLQEAGREIAGESEGDDGPPGEKPPAAQGPIATLIHVAPAPGSAESGMTPAAPLPQLVEQAVAEIETYLELDDDVEVIHLPH